MMSVDMLCLGLCWQDRNCANAWYKSPSAFKGFASHKRVVFVYMSVNFGSAYSKHTVKGRDMKKKVISTGSGLVSRQRRVRKKSAGQEVFLRAVGIVECGHTAFWVN